MPDSPDSAERSAGEWIRVLARAPRPAGGAAESEARALAAGHLRQHGFDVTEAPFTYSTWPGRYGTSLAGAVAVATVAAAGHLGYHGYRLGALELLVGMALIVGVWGWWMGRHGVLALPVGRASGINLVATRGRPTVWLVAHLDSKSQPVPILVRAAAIVATGGWWVAASVVAALHGGRGWWVLLTLIGILGALPVAASLVGASSDGAVDNASGVAAVLLAAAGVPAAVPLGVLLTSAEELGLAGARGWLVGPPLGTPLGTPPGVAINCDGVDDSGYLSLMYSRRRPARLVGAFGRGLRVRRLLPGVLVDGVAFADAGWEAVTVSRGTVGSLWRIHRPADRADRMTGVGAAAAAEAIVSAVSEL